MSTAAAKAETRFTELRRHQVYRLNRPAKHGLISRLRRGLRGHLAR